MQMNKQDKKFTIGLNDGIKNRRYNEVTSKQKKEWWLFCLERYWIEVGF